MKNKLAQKATAPQFSAADSENLVLHTLPLSGISDLVQLGKPRIVVLLLVSTAAAMVLGSNAEPSVGPLLWVLLGGGLVCASAAACNCIWECDIDGLMERTRERPLPGHRLSLTAAWLFAAGTGIAGVSVLYFQVNAASAITAAAGHIVYSIIYTYWLKRRSHWNVVVGGLAGALAPVVGWTAATGSVELPAVILGLVVFLWTPPHFWALAIVRADEYKRAGVPMLPVVHGFDTTVNQMLFYALLLVPVTAALPYMAAALGLFTLLGSMALNVDFIRRIVWLTHSSSMKASERSSRAWSVFAYSLVYLSLYFFVLVIDAYLVTGR